MTVSPALLLFSLTCSVSERPPAQLFVNEKQGNADQRHFLHFLFKEFDSILSSRSHQVIPAVVCCYSAIRFTSSETLNSM